MNPTTISGLGEKELSALNAKADARAAMDAIAWDEAIDWGIPDYSSPPAWRMANAPDFD